MSLSAIHFGFSQADADSHAQILNSRYNIRCAPAQTLNPANPPQLLSLCQDPTCPLHPTPDCDAYVNLTATGNGNGNSGGGPPSSSPTTVLPSPSEEPSIITSPEPKQSTPPEEPDSNGFSVGAIAGTAIGGAALVLGFSALMIWLFCFKKRKMDREELEPIPFAPPPEADKQPFSPPMSPDPHNHEHHTVNELGFNHRALSQTTLGRQSSHAGYSTREDSGPYNYMSPDMSTLAEMECPSTPAELAISAEKGIMGTQLSPVESEGRNHDQDRPGRP